MKKILIVSFSQIHSDPRVMRQVRLLESLYDVTVAGFGKKPDANIQFISLDYVQSGKLDKLFQGLILLLGLFETRYWRLPYVQQAAGLIDVNEYDLMIANDVSALPLLYKTKHNKPVILDAHEYSPREFEESFVWRLTLGRYNHFICKKYLGRATFMTTVCQGIADEYQRQYRVKSQVVYSAPTFKNLVPSPVDAGKIRLIHHGASIRARHLETMIAMMNHLDKRFTLDFMLVNTNPAYLAELKSLASSDNRIRFLDTVPMDEICQTINQYDVGVYILPPINFNHKHAMPNKFFEFIQASLTIAIGPSPEMAKLLMQHGLGVVAGGFAPKQLAEALNRLTAEEISAFKQASFQAAKDINAENQGKVILNAVQVILNRQS